MRIANLLQRVEEEIYTQANDFVPERWYSRPEMIKDRSAYAPFMIGTYACIGKPLALMDLRLTTARIVMNYNMTFPEGGDRGAAFVDGLVDQFVVKPAKLEVCFQPRTE